MAVPTREDIRCAIGELTAEAEVKRVETYKLETGKIEVLILMEVPRAAVKGYLEAMLEHAEEREEAAEDRHLDAMHEAACGA